MRWNRPITQTHVECHSLQGYRFTSKKPVITALLQKKTRKLVHHFAFHKDDLGIE